MWMSVFAPRIGSPMTLTDLEAESIAGDEPNQTAAFW
jgi:hypothetical protein